MKLLYRYKIFLIASSLFLSSFFFFLYWFFFLPSSKALVSKTITIKKGMPLKKVSAMLKEEGIIGNKYVFTGVAAILGKKAGIKAGEYELNTRMSPAEVLDTLVKGQVKRHLVTIVEGYTLSQITLFLDNLKIVERQTFLNKASSPVFIATLDLPSFFGEEDPSTLEGFLFPDTYHFIKEMDPEEVIRMMIHRLKEVFGPDLVSRAWQLGVSPRKILILASMIEKETPLAEEKPLISAVFHNRLRMKIPLQSDPTVIYGIKDFDGNLTKEHLLQLTPYNTYLIQGLPPTPICNPGKDSILAALNPASVPYLYFVSRNDGSHSFSSDIEDHQRAVWKYQKKRQEKLNDNLLRRDLGSI